MLQSTFYWLKSNQTNASCFSYFRDPHFRGWIPVPAIHLLAEDCWEARDLYVAETLYQCGVG